MENDIRPLDEGLFSTPDSKPKIYSRMAVRGFAIFMTPVFGGILLMQNLRDIGNKKAANIILFVSLLFTALTIVVVFNTTKSSLTYVCNIAGGVVLSEYFYKKHFANENEYEKKKITKPLIIAVAIIAFFILVQVLTI